jgi:hypothetical protein
MKYVVLDFNNGKVFPDMNLYQEALNFCNSDTQTITIGSELFFHQFRLLIKTKVIDNEDYQFIFKTDKHEMILNVSSDGVFCEWYPLDYNVSFNTIVKII